MFFHDSRIFEKWFKNYRFGVKILLGGDNVAFKEENLEVSEPYFHPNELRNFVIIGAYLHRDFMRIDNISLLTYELCSKDVRDKVFNQLLIFLSIKMINRIVTTVREYMSLYIMRPFLQSIGMRYIDNSIIFSMHK